MSEAGTDHAQHWDTSVWPLVISASILFLLPFPFSLHFVYGQSLIAVLSLGIGVPMCVIGIAGWVSEALAEGKGEGLSSAAMGWFIVAEAMIFVSFFATYWFIRLSAGSWPPPGSVELPVVLPAIMTLVLVSSSFTIHAGEQKLEAGDTAGFRTWLLITMVLGAAFLSMSVYEWRELIGVGFTISTNAMGTAFFSITGFHGAHVAVGIGIFLAILLPALKGKADKPLVRAASVYWHFVDIIWFFVVSQVYYW